jgi:topoisomerase IV subunit A
VYLIQKFHPQQTISAFYFNANNGNWYLKRFQIETTSLEKKFNFIGEDAANKLLACSTHENPEIEIKYADAKKKKHTEILKVAEQTDIKGWKAQGLRYASGNVQGVNLLSPRVGEFTVPGETVQEQMQQEKDVPPGGQLNLL